MVELLIKFQIILKNTNEKIHPVLSRLELNIKGKKGKTGKLVFFVDYNNYIFPENRNIELTDIGHLTDFKNIVYNYIWTIPYDVYASRFEKIVSGYFPK